MEDDQDALDRLGLMGASFDPPRVSHTDMNTLQVRYNATLHTGLAAKKLGITFLENQCLYTMEYIRAIATATGLRLEHQIDNQDVCEVMLSLLEEEKERVAMDEKSGDNSEECEDEPAGMKTPAPTHVMTERSSRITAEPASNFWTIRVKLFDETIQIRNFAKQGTYQEVYDWIGFVTERPHFTLHRARGDVCKHGDQLTSSEMLHFVIRSESEATEMLRSEVSFGGNYTNQNTSLESTLNGEPNKKKKKTNEGNSEEVKEAEESTEDLFQGEPNKLNEDRPIQNEACPSPEPFNCRKLANFTIKVGL
ncbi:hypothetical protein OS493_012366 [Desmophyllum pertusum]|uniref:Uncharacterized protein n=1 Tax=Desmophyllum pertusum TaxID=174260 RepID=A0A9W9ZS87_9CNID|nr:hypothetical protein OS493_012366 [Desmophyllum pertusum]